MAPFGSPPFSFRIAARAASTLFLIQHSRDFPCISWFGQCIWEGFCLLPVGGVAMSDWMKMTYPMPSTRLVWKRMVISNFDAWCSMMKNTSLRIWATDTYSVITLLLSIHVGTVQGSTNICLFLPRYSSDISIYCYPIITLQQVAVTMFYW